MLLQSAMAAVFCFFAAYQGGENVLQGRDNVPFDTGQWSAPNFKKRNRAINADVVITFILVSGDVPAQPLPAGDAMFAHAFASADAPAAVKRFYPDLGLMLLDLQCAEFRPVL
ncbi:hypothetical protein WKI40_11450 [Kosakonia sacchari]|uniref:hypothetical protein n=1 Tax=Kosakonia sacchari TaxID=1158459 RepID=UPI0030C2E774